MLRFRRLHLVCTMLTFAALSGCTQTDTSNQRFELGIDPQDSPYSKSAAYRDTIGAMGHYDGITPMRVRGYGLIVGLGKNGSADCPKPVYNKLIQSIYKQQQATSSVVGSRDVSPEKLIADLDTAVVIVQGEIPAAATRGTRFDVQVMAVPGTQTKSLSGGRLYTTELEVYRELPSGLSIVGQVLVRAGGPVLLNPFADAGAATQSIQLEGTVVDGGLVLQDRRIRFVLSQPSYRNARTIESRINAQFPGGKIADAVSPSFIQISVPPEYRDDPGHFLELVRSLYLNRDPQFEATRARELAAELVSQTSQHARIALCFEGLGRSATAVLDELYRHPKDHVSFHAALAGLRLGDDIAADRIAGHAEQPNGQFRFPAIRALGAAGSMASAALPLRRLLHDRDASVQIAAYEALVERQDRTIASRAIAGDNFLLDLIPTESNKFVYAKRTGSRRIAVFGDGIHCVPPVLYRAADGSVTINADAQAEELTILRTIVASGTTSPPIHAPLDVPRLIELLGGEAGADVNGKATGLGLDYGAVIRALYHLSEQHAVNAKFMLEQPNVTDLLGPAERQGRPESEL